jgi:hypothetical protein
VLGAVLGLFGLLTLGRSGSTLVSARARRLAPPPLAGPSSACPLALSPRPPPNRELV